MTKASLFLAAVLLAGASAQAQALCDVSRVQDFIDKTFDASMENEIKEKAGADLVRHTEKGGIFLTKDLNPNRLSITVDEEGKIKSFACN